MVRISGPCAGEALRTLGGRLVPRRAQLTSLRNPGSGGALDQALTLWFPGPATATGEDVAELHLHGGRAVVAAVLDALARCADLRPARAGEFTRRSFENGRIDLAEAEGLSDLLAAETESQRRAALLLAEGGLGRLVSRWQARVLTLAAQVEAALDFSDEDDVSFDQAALRSDLAALHDEISAHRIAPPAERLRDGVRIVLAGPPNAGKSSLFNALIDRDAAIVSEVEGTTRDRIEAPVVVDGVALLLIDTAGLRESDDAIETLGIARTQAALAEADLILWLGDASACPSGAILVAAKADLFAERPGLAVSVQSGEGLPALRAALVSAARTLLPAPDAIALNARHRALLAEIDLALANAIAQHDLLIIAEELRQVRSALDAITGRAGVEDMLDALFGNFCIGK